MDLLKLPDPRESRPRPYLEADKDEDSGIEDEPRTERNSTIFVAFKGDIKDQDLQQKLEKIMQGVPELIDMECGRLKLQKVEPWNSVRVTFNIPREAAERLRLLAQGNNQQLRDLGILSVQIEGEGAINLALAQNPAQEVRMNGPMAASNAMRVDPSFAVQGRVGLIRMNNPAAAGTMMSQGPHVSSSMMAAGGSAELQPRTPRPSSQQDVMDPLVSGLTVQQQSHQSGSLAPQLHPTQAIVGNRPANPANFQQFQQQARLPQHQQVSQGIRPPFATPAQVPVPVPPGWNQLASGALQPPPAPANMGAIVPNQQWKKSALGAGGPLQQQQQFPQRPSLSAVQTPSHPPPPYPFGSQQASQVHSNFPSMANSNQFNAPSMKPMQTGSPRVLTPLQQPHLSKSPASSPSSFQQSSPASSPTVNQTQPQAMGPRPGQGSSLPQSFQQQTVSSPGRSSVMSQGSTAGNFMMQQNPGPQGIHGGVPKRLPPGFTAGQTNANFLQGQNPPSTAGSPTNVATAQQQVTAAGQGAGGQGNGSSHNQLQGSHGGVNVMQTNLIGLHNNLNNQQTSGSGVSQVNIGGLHGQAQQGPQSQILGMHQQLISSQGQMVNLQGQASLNSQGQLVLSRAQLMSQGQMLAGSQNMGQAPQRMTPPKQMIPSHSQMMAAQNQAIMQQNPIMEQIMQGNKQAFNNQNPGGVMAGPSQIVRGQAPGLANNMVQFSGQAISQQGGNPTQGVIQNQVLRQVGPGQHLQQPHAETSAQSTGDLGGIMSDLSMQQAGNMAPQHPQHLQNMPGNNGPGQHFPGHGLPFNSPFGQGGNGNQLLCGQNPAFPVNKDVTLTSPLLVNLLQSDISAGHFGVNSKQNTAAAKPKKKKPPRKKKNQQGEEHMNAAESRLEESDQSGIVGDQLGALDAGQKLSEFQNRPPGYPTPGLEQRQLQQIPPQLMQLGQQQGQGAQNQQPTPPQQMMMMLMMQQQQQQQQQQEQKTVRLSLQQNIFNPRAVMNPDAQRMSMQQGGNMPAMVNLQSTGSIPPSPDKQRMAMVSNASLGGNGRKMGFPEGGQNATGSPLGDGSSAAQLGDIPELSTTPGSQNNMPPHMLMAQNPMMMAGSKPGAASSLSLTQGTSPQQQHSNTIGGPHGHHYQNVQTPSQTSRPKTPNRASPRPYYPQTPNNRPPSTEPSEISLSPERLNASIAGLFPPQINIPLPPRPTLNRGFDQQGLNPTTLKAIGQAPPGLTVSNQSAFVSHMNKMDNGAGKPPTAGASKRASPSNSRRSSPASSRKTTPSPGRQNSKAPKMVLGGQQTPGMLHSMEMQRNMLAGQPSVQPPQASPLIGQYPSPTIPSAAAIIEEIKESSSLIQEHESQSMQMIPKDRPVVEHKTDINQEIKMVSSEELAKKDALFLEAPKLSRPEDLSAISPAMRDAPTSLSQLLDHSGAPNVNIKPPGPLSETSIRLPPTEDSKTKDIASLSGDMLKDAACVPNTHPYTESSNVQPRTDAVDNNTNVPLNLPGNALKRPGGPTAASSSMTPNQITVFVTSNPITPSASVSASMTSQLKPTLVPTVVTMASVGNKVIVSEGQPPVQSSTRPQFITPVFFNSSSIIQVMKGSQQSSVPSPNTNLMPPSVAVVGPLHISQNIQYPAPSSSAIPSSNTNSLTTTRAGLSSPVQMTTQLAPSSSPSPLSQAPAKMQYSSDDLKTQPGSASDLSSPVNVKTTLSPTVGSNAEPPGSKFLMTPSMGQGKVTNQDHMESSEAGCSSAGGPGRSPSLSSQTGTESNSSSTLSMDTIVHTSSTPVDLLPFPSPNPPMMLLAEKSSESALSEQISTTFDETVPEQILETVFPQNPGSEEGTSNDNQSASEKPDADMQENMECEPEERSSPPSRRNSRLEDFPVPQDIMESGQRKRAARPSSSSSSAKESGASPTQPKRRKSK